MGGKQSSNLSTEGLSPQRRTNRPSHEFLTETELAAVRSTWVRIQTTKNMQAMGVKIFLRIFELEPQTKQAFESFRNLETEELVTNVLFRSHATRFMKAVEVTMNNLDALDVIIVPNLKHLGRLHTEIGGFHVEYLRAFEMAMEEVWAEELGSSFRDECQIAWNKIFNLITSKVMEGYGEAKSEGSQSSTPSRRITTKTTTAAAAKADDNISDGHQQHPAAAGKEQQRHQSETSASNGGYAPSAPSNHGNTDVGARAIDS